jgi:hypothetical protein
VGEALLTVLDLVTNNNIGLTGGMEGARANQLEQQEGGYRG